MHLGRRREREVARVALGVDAGDLADAVDVALHPVAAHRVADAEGRLEVHAIACREPAERGAPKCLGTALNIRIAPSRRATVRQHPSTATESPTRASAAIPGASTARSTPPPDGSHDRICPDSMTMPVKIYGS